MLGESAAQVSDVQSASSRLTSLFARRPSRDPLPDGPEFVHYVAVKFFVYRRALDHGTVRASQGEASGIPFRETFTARRLRTSVSPGIRHGFAAADQFLELVDTTPHSFRERLRLLNHGSFLLERGRGLRQAIEYEWQEPILYSNLCSYLALGRLLGGRLHYALDMYRIRVEFQGESFTATEFRNLVIAHREMQSIRRWYGVRGSLSSGALFRFAKIIAGRLSALIQSGLVTQEGGVLRLSGKGAEAAHWFDLFVHSVSYRPSVQQCEECPLQGPCWSGRFGRAIGIDHRRLQAAAR